MSESDRLTDLEARRRKLGEHWMLSFVLWQVPMIGSHIMHDLPARYAFWANFFVVVSLIGAAWWAVVTFRLVRFGNLLANNPRQRAALEDERWQQQKTFAFACGFWALLAFAAMLVGIGAFGNRLLLVLGHIGVLVGVLGVAVGWLWSEGRDE